MSTSTVSARKPKWNKQEVHGLLDYLETKKSQGEGAGNFKDSRFRNAVTVIAPLLSTGPLKTFIKCKAKWAGLKSTYMAIVAYQLTGAHWDNTNGANIQGTIAALVFEAYVSKESNTLMRAFRNKGWEYYEKCASIMYSSAAAPGSHAFCPTAATVPAIPDEAEEDVNLLAGPSAMDGKNTDNQTTTSSSLSSSSLSANTSAIIGMQGSINRLIDIFEKSMMSHLAEDRDTMSRNRAIELLQERKDHLSSDQKVKMIYRFMDDVSAANTYISLTDPDLRQAWISTIA